MRLALSLGLLLCCVCHSASAEWPRWERFKENFIESSGRVVDLHFEKKTTSEGQSYAMFYALVANDRATFDRLLQWTERELAGGDLTARLPAWHWGIRENGRWGIKDPNAASDADLFIAYSLLEAARLWQVPRYADIGRGLLEQVKRHEIADAGKGGLVLLPGPQGFVLDGGRRFRVDPSYLPGFQFNYFAHVDPKGPWKRVWDAYLQHAPKVFAMGVAPDLYVVDVWGNISPDPDRPNGGYDAIRVYTWAAISGRNSDRLLRLLAPFATLVRARGGPPEYVDPRTGLPMKDFSPIGFSGAVLPFLAVLGDRDALGVQQRRLSMDRMRQVVTRHYNYYDECLILFGEGWVEGRYRFDEQGRLWPQWLQRDAKP